MSIVYSGIQPSGELHLGNYFGAVKKWLELQENYSCIFSVADYHAMTGACEKQDLSSSTRKLVKCLLATGVDPEKSTLYLQSAVKEHTELAWMLFTLTPLGLLERLPHFKEKAVTTSKCLNLGLLAYPVLQAADIMLYKANIVPIGEDQEMHVDLTRDLVKRFNRHYKEIFPKPKAVFSHDPRILGLDGHFKMSKSKHNSIAINDSPETVAKKIRAAVTDPHREKRSDAGNPLECNIYSLHKAVSSEDEVAAMYEDCCKASIGCVDCKDKLITNLENLLVPIREKATELDKRPDYISDVILEGNKKCSVKARETMSEVRNAVGLMFP